MSSLIPRHGFQVDLDCRIVSGRVIFIYILSRSVSVTRLQSSFSPLVEEIFKFGMNCTSTNMIC